MKTAGGRWGQKQKRKNLHNNAIAITDGRPASPTNYMLFVCTNRYFSTKLRRGFHRTVFYGVNFLSTLRAAHPISIKLLDEIARDSSRYRVLHTPAFSQNYPTGFGKIFTYFHGDVLIIAPEKFSSVAGRSVQRFSSLGWRRHAVWTVSRGYPIPEMLFEKYARGFGRRVKMSRGFETSTQRRE